MKRRLKTLVHHLVLHPIAGFLWALETERGDLVGEIIHNLVLDEVE